MDLGWGCLGHDHLEAHQQVSVLEAQAARAGHAHADEFLLRHEDSADRVPVHLRFHLSCTQPPGGRLQILGFQPDLRGLPAWQRHSQPQRPPGKHLVHREVTYIQLHERERGRHGVRYACHVKRHTGAAKAHQVFVVLAGANQEWVRLLVDRDGDGREAELHAVDLAGAAFEAKLGAVAVPRADAHGVDFFQRLVRARPRVGHLVYDPDLQADLARHFRTELVVLLPALPPTFLLAPAYN
eukprot:scaffold744_cov240-Pinguiococcus_pyrenoidosus.AAC.9